MRRVWQRLIVSFWQNDQQQNRDETETTVDDGTGFGQFFRGHLRFKGKFHIRHEMNLLQLICSSATYLPLRILPRRFVLECFFPGYLVGRFMDRNSIRMLSLASVAYHFSEEGFCKKSEAKEYVLARGTQGTHRSREYFVAIYGNDSEAR